MGTVTFVNCSIAGMAAEELLERGMDENPYLAHDSLERYYLGLAAARREIANIFTADEIGATLEAMTGVWIEGARDVVEFVDHIANAVAQDDLGSSEEDSPSTLVQKLMKLNFNQRDALLDAIQRWFHYQKCGKPLQFSELLSAPTPCNLR